jgi:hypothetical protein
MTFMDRREMMCQTAHELLCATGAVAAHASDEDIAKHARALEDRYGVLAAIYIGMLAERLMRYQDSLRSGHDGRAGNAWDDLVHIAPQRRTYFLGRSTWLRSLSACRSWRARSNVKDAR